MKYMKIIYNIYVIHKISQKFYNISTEEWKSVINYERLF